MSTGPKESKAETPSGASPGAALPGLTMAGQKGRQQHEKD
nr:MAG TPA: hypothetical protein [Bacteriophage sp.]